MQQRHTYKQQGWQQRTKRRSDNSKPTAWQQLTGVMSMLAAGLVRPVAAAAPAAHEDWMHGAV
jgi:hypothetical protein